MHWGTSDYRFLRNAMLFASGVGMAALWLLDERSPGALTLVWAVTGGWITLRALLGAARIWPGIGRPPLRTGTSA